MSKRSVSHYVKTGCKMLAESQKTFGDIFEALFRFPDEVMAETSRGEEIVRYTGGELRQRITRMASGLFRVVGGSGEFVALYGENSVDWLCAFWAILMSGNKPYLVNLRQPDSFNEEMIRLLGCRFSVFPNGEGKPFGTHAYTASELLASDTTEDLPLFGDEIALTTSGTTLSPKVCVYHGAQVADQIFNSRDMLRANKEVGGRYRRDVKILVFLPMYHIFGLEATYLWFGFYGPTLVFPENRAPSALTDTVKRHGVTHIFAVPLLWHSIDKALLRELDSLDEKSRKKFDRAVKTSLRLQNIAPHTGLLIARRMFRPVRGKLFGESVRFCVTGGAAIRQETMDRLTALGYPLFGGYGMTEIGIACVDLSRKPKDRNCRSVGKPCASLSFSLGGDGMLFVDGTSVCRDVIRDGKRQAPDMPFATGDIFARLPDGRYTVCGRESDIVFGAGGEKLNPDAAESELRLPSARAFSVLGNEQNDRLRLIVSYDPNANTEELHTLMGEVKAETDALPLTYHIPEIYYTPDEILAAGEIKVSRAKLRRAVESGAVTLAKTPIAVTGTEKPDRETWSELALELRTMVSDLLRIDPEKITLDAHFMNDLGGTSLDFFEFISNVAGKYGVEMQFGGEATGYTLREFEKILGEMLGK